MIISPTETLSIPPQVSVSLETAQKKLQEFISYQAKAIDGDFTGQGPFPGQPQFYCEKEGCK